MNRIKLFIPLFIFIVLSVFFWRGLSLDPSEMPSALIDKPFPEFSLISLNEDKMLSRDDLLQQVSLVNIWATWCAACRYEHPVFNQLAAEGINIIGVNYKDDSQAAVKWLDDLGNPYQFTIVDQQGKLALDLGVFGAPETYLVDKQGMIRHKHVGIVDLEAWEKIIKPLYQKYNQ